MPGPLHNSSILSELFDQHSILHRCSLFLQPISLICDIYIFFFFNLKLIITAVNRFGNKPLTLSGHLIQMVGTGIWRGPALSYNLAAMKTQLAAVSITGAGMDSCGQSGWERSAGGQLRCSCWEHAPQGCPWNKPSAKKALRHSS